MALLSRMEFDSPLLDLGCGDGRIVQHLLGSSGDRTHPHRVFGLDLNENSVRLALARPIHRAAIVADARAMPFGDAAFASVLSVCVLEHIPAPDRVLAEASRVLKPNGLLAFSVPTARLSEIAAETHPRTLDYPAVFAARVEHVNSWPHSAWQALLQRNGLAPCDLIGFMPPDAARVWFAANDWVERPIRGRGWLYRVAGPGLRRGGLGRLLAAYWFRRLRPAAIEGVAASPDEAAAVLILARKPG
jgi:SAM-dependent methyltransferase